MVKTYLRIQRRHKQQLLTIKINEPDVRLHPSHPVWSVNSSGTWRHIYLRLYPGGAVPGVAVCRPPDAPPVVRAALPPSLPTPCRRSHARRQRRRPAARGAAEEGAWPLHVGRRAGPLGGHTGRASRRPGTGWRVERRRQEGARRRPPLPARAVVPHRPTRGARGRGAIRRGMSGRLPDDADAPVLDTALLALVRAAAAARPAGGARVSGGAARLSGGRGARPAPAARAAADAAPPRRRRHRHVPSGGRPVCEPGPRAGRWRLLAILLRVPARSGPLPSPSGAALLPRRAAGARAAVPERRRGHHVSAGEGARHQPAAGRVRSRGAQRVGHHDDGYAAEDDCGVHPDRLPGGRLSRAGCIPEPHPGAGPRQLLQTGALVGRRVPRGVPQTHDRREGDPAPRAQLMLAGRSGTRQLPSRWRGGGGRRSCGWCVVMCSCSGLGLLHVIGSVWAERCYRHPASCTLLLYLFVMLEGIFLFLVFPSSMESIVALTRLLMVILIWRRGTSVCW